MKDKVVLIAGANGRIGFAVVEKILAAGFRVAAIDVQTDCLESLCDQRGERLLIIDKPCVTESDISGCLGDSLKFFGRIDAAIYAAYPKSAGWGACLEELKEVNLHEDITNLLGGTIMFSKVLARYFKLVGAGNLILVSSVMGVQSPKFEAYVGTSMTSPVEYSAVKAGIIAVTKYLSKYLKGNNVRVNCVSPGGIDDMQPQVFKERYRSYCNDKGLLSPEDVSGVFLFLLSEASRYVTGQNIIIDDGWSL